jgi:hypothetical protein
MQLICKILIVTCFFSCSYELQVENLPDTICQTILKVHEEYPFKIDEKYKSVVLGNFINVYYPQNKSFKEFYITLREEKFQCGNLNLLLVDGMMDSSPSFKFIQRISYHIDDPGKDKIVLSRSTFENDTSRMMIGVDNRIGENFYLSKHKGKWIIDSLTYDISM